MSILTRVFAGRKSTPKTAAPAPGAPTDPRRKPLTRAEILSVAGLSLPALGGAYLSWHGMSAGAAEALDSDFAGWVVPVVVDGAIFGSAIRWVTAVRAGRVAFHWRAWTHVFVALTIALNAYASTSIESSPWHVAAPLIWSVLIELVARDAAGEHDAEAGRPADRIPARLWWSAFGESWRKTLLMARTGERSARKAGVRADAGRAAVVALRVVLPARADRKSRRELERRILAGSLSAPEAFETVVDRIGLEGLSAAKVALVEACRVAATRDGSDTEADGSDGSDGSDGRMDGSDGWADGSPAPLGLELVNGARMVSGRVPVGADGSPNGHVNGSASRAVPAAGGSGGGGRVAGVRVGGSSAGGSAPRSSANPDDARPSDVERAHELIATGELVPDSTGKIPADTLKDALRISRRNAAPLREYLIREHNERTA